MTDETPPPDGSTTWSWRAPCGDRLQRTDDRLVLEAVFPVEGLEASRYRSAVLRVGDARYTLTAIEGDPRRPTYRFALEVQNLYALPGELVVYDPDRHRARAHERRRLALAWLLFIPLVPLTPLLGLLPEGAKRRLGALGLDAGRATRLSLMFEWLLLFFALLGYLFSGGLLSAPGAVLGALCLLLAVDIAYRVAADYDNRAPGMFGVVGACRDLAVELWRTRGRPIDPDDGDGGPRPAAPP